MSIYDVGIINDIVEQGTINTRYFIMQNVLPAYIKDCSGRYLSANDKFLNLFSVKDIIGKTDSEVFDSELAASFSEKDRAAVLSFEPVVFVENVIVGKKSFFCNTIRFPFSFLNDGDAHVLYVAVDISDCGLSKSILQCNIQSFSSSVEKVGIDIDPTFNPFISKINSYFTGFKSVPFKEIVDDIFNRFNVIASGKAIDLLIKVDDSVPDVVFACADELVRLVVLLIELSVIRAKGTIKLNFYCVSRDLKQCVIRSSLSVGAPRLSSEARLLLSHVFDSCVLGTSLEILRSGDKYNTYSFDFSVIEMKQECDSDSCVPSNSCVSAADYSIVNKKILLVEDNLISQRIVFEILKNYGAIVSLAGNGLEAIDIFKLEHFDLVLMDVEMPVLNGYDATREIVSLQSALSVKTPIIGLTALELDVNKQKCLNAGMCDVIVKPVMPEELVDCIIRNIFAVDNKSSNKSYGVVLPDFIDSIKSIDYKEGLARLSGNDKLYTELIMSFRDKYKDFCLMLYDVILKGKKSTVLFELHSLKNASGSIAAKNIFKNCVALSDVIAADDESDVMVFLQYLQDAFLEFERELRHIDYFKLPASESIDDVLPDIDNINRVLVLLNTSITGDIDLAVAFNCLDELNDILLGTIYYKQFLILKDTINKFDLVNAAKCLSNFIELLNIRSGELN